MNNITGTLYLKRISLSEKFAITGEPGFNDFGLYNTSLIASDILWYQLIPHCLPKLYTPRLLRQ
jgi:hypothetical protein